MEEIIQCPFNASHRLVRNRMPYHIVKCKKNYHGPPLVPCPYNAMHMTPPEEMKSHVVDCPDYQIVMGEKYLKSANVGCSWSKK